MGADGRRSGEACESACGFCIGAPSWPHSEGPDGPIMDDVDPFPEEGVNAFNNDDEVDDNGVGNDDDDDDADGAACADDPQWQKDGSKTKACAWVAEKFSRCDTKGADGRDAIEACKEACGMCATPAPVARKAREDPPRRASFFRRDTYSSSSGRRSRCSCCAAYSARVRFAGLRCDMAA